MGLCSWYEFSQTDLLPTASVGPKQQTLAAPQPNIRLTPRRLLTLSWSPWVQIQRAVEKQQHELDLKLDQLPALIEMQILAALQGLGSGAGGTASSCGGTLADVSQSRPQV